MKAHPRILPADARIPAILPPPRCRLEAAPGPTRAAAKGRQGLRAAIEPVDPNSPVSSRHDRYLTPDTALGIDHRRERMAHVPSLAIHRPKAVDALLLPSAIQLR